MTETNTIDTRSYFPEFTRSVVLPDGVSYFVRELQDLPIGVFNRIIADEERFGDLNLLERHELEKQHLQTMLIAPVTMRGSAAKGATVLSLQGDGDLSLNVGDVIHLSGGLFFERNEVAGVAEDRRTVTVRNPWLFDAREGARVYRSPASAVLDLLTFSEFARVVSTAKRPQFLDESPVPQTAASESTS